MLRKRHLIPLLKLKVQKVEAHHPSSILSPDRRPSKFKGPKSRILGEKCQSSWGERKGRPYTITERALLGSQVSGRGKHHEMGRSLSDSDRNIDKRVSL